MTIVSASLTVNGNVTTLSVTLKNEGDVSFRVFGLTLHGEFNATRTWEQNRHEDKEDGQVVERIHPDTIPFKLNGSSLIPLFGNGQENDDDRGRQKEHDDIQQSNMNEDVKFSSLTLQPMAKCYTEFQQCHRASARQGQCEISSDSCKTYSWRQLHLETDGRGFPDLYRHSYVLVSPIPVPPFIFSTTLG